MNALAILIGLGPLIGWGFFPTLAVKIGGKPVNQIIGTTFGALIFGIVYNQVMHLGFPSGTNLFLAILSGLSWDFGQILTFYVFTILSSSRAQPISTAFQLLGASLWGVFALGNWPTVLDKIIGFIALALIIFGAWLTNWTEKKSTSNSKNLKKATLIMLISEIGYWGYSAAPQAATINGEQAFLPQTIGMAIGAVLYAIFLAIKDKDHKNALLEKVSYKQILTGFSFAFAALTYLISAQPNMNGLATGFVLSQTSVVLASLTGIWMLHQKKTKKEMKATVCGLVIIVVAAAMTVI